MDKKLASTIQYYSDASRIDLPEAVRVGRSASMADIEPLILADILNKIQLRNGQSLLDLGCGSGFMAVEALKLAKRMSASATLVDFPQVISLLEKVLQGQKELGGSGVRLLSGAFPEDKNLSSNLGKYDRIIIYSVIHYTDRPDKLVQAAANLLQPGGILLVGDIPNLSKKGRFLASNAGRAFEAEYRGVHESSLPVYTDHEHFAQHHREPGCVNLDDDFIVGMIKDLRLQGFNAYVTEQPSHLPYSKTREDLLISRPEA